MFNIVHSIKEFCYRKLHRVNRCICGGRIKTDGFRRGNDDWGWIVQCNKCGYLYDED